MRKKLSTIGNSRALILPEDLLERYGFGEDVELEPTSDGLIIRPATHGLSFQEAKAKLLTEKRELLARLSDA